MSRLRSHRQFLRNLYRAVWYPALPIALMLAGGNESSVRRARLGHLDRELPPVQQQNLRIWAHAASVGEVEALRPVLSILTRELQRLEIVFTTMTVAGRDAAIRRIPALSACQLAPLDFAPGVRRLLSAVHPKLILIAETELWPNFFFEGAAGGAKIAIVNGRLSERSLRRYGLASELFAATLEHANLILAQTSADADRFVRLGALPDRVVVTGNTKFDLQEPPAPLRPALADFVRDRALLVAGSTAPGEERMVLNTYRNLAERFPNSALAIAPRHLERVREVEAELQNAGVAYVKASSGASPGERSANVLLLDTMGELRALYHRAAIAFVGGSMNPPRGGQSLAEPAAASIPILFGPHYDNQREIGDALIAAGGGCVINDGAELESACVGWLANDNARMAAGKAARGVIQGLANGAELAARHLIALAREA